MNATFASAETDGLLVLETVARPDLDDAYSDGRASSRPPPRSPPGSGRPHRRRPPPRAPPRPCPPRAVEPQLHLHRLEHDGDLPGLDLVADRDRDPAARWQASAPSATAGRGDRSPVRARRRRAGTPSRGTARGCRRRDTAAGDLAAPKDRHGFRRVPPACTPSGSGGTSGTHVPVDPVGVHTASSASRVGRGRRAGTPGSSARRPTAPRRAPTRRRSMQASRSAALGDHLREERVEAELDDVTLAQRRVDPDAGPVRERRAGRLVPPDGRKPCGGVLRVDARLDRVARCANVVLRDPEPLAAGDPSCARTRSTPVTASVTGCSTWSRAFISRKHHVPSASSRNSPCRRPS